jgi:dynein heavy chain, axonemal
MPDSHIDPSLDGLLSKDYEHVNHRYYTRIGENRVEVDPSTKIYVYTKIANPAFRPEVFIKLSVINFTVTPEGLEDQLLAEVVDSEIPEVESKKRELVLVISKGRLTLARNEDSILALLNDSKGNILDDVELIKNLKESKKVSAEVNASLEESVVKSQEIEQARMVYKPMANRGALLYLIVTELSSIESMYQFSLEYFNRIFKGVLASIEASETTEERVRQLMQGLTRTVYLNISRALFNQHKKIFSFIMACRISRIPKLEYDYCNKGNFALPKEVKDPKSKEHKDAK